MPKRKLTADAFRNEHGAFDLPSILVGVVVVGILTAGVLATIFGVIPFAQDKGAEQDLDSVRTAQGVSKAKDGRFDTSTVLAGHRYLNMPENVGAVTDGPGSCYVAAARSGSGKTFIASSAAPSPVQLTEAPANTCVPVEQLKQLVGQIGGTWPGGDTPSSALTYTALTASDANPSNAVATEMIAYMNLELGLDSSPETLSLAQSDYATWDAYEASPAYQAEQAAVTPAVYHQYYEMWQSLKAENPDVTATWTAWRDAQNVFWASPEAATKAAQKTMIDAQRAFYMSLLSKPSTALPELVAAPSFASDFGDRTIAAGTQRMTFTVAAPAGTDVSVLGPGQEFFGEAWTKNGTNAYGVVSASGEDNGFHYWSIEVDTWENSTLRGQDMNVFVGVRINGIVHYKMFKVTVAP
ncbi:hypothetical protein [Pseudarthrobacter chlorophenolicus]|uniref:hypothetical protein n=1 Tax=Pseudarthrobacter chlorophenolicus TaxID=85085 RepID=UPI0005C195C4|nr:hypothetical protein [Pseudarthrobacter chlorophenolicus]